MVTFRGHRPVSEREQVISLILRHCFNTRQGRLVLYGMEGDSTSPIGGVDQWLLFGGRVVKVKLT
jgi:hypothetical protein